MTAFWYYAEDDVTRGPLSLSELLPLLSRIADPRRVMIRRLGFDDWKAVEDVREVAQQLFRPPPLRAGPPPSVPPTMPVRGPVVGVADAAEFKYVQPMLSGIGGWLGLLALGQVMGILRLIVSIGQYYTTVSDELWKHFPTAIWGEAALNAIMVGLCVYTVVLLLRHSRQFPRFFIWQMIFVVCMPLLDLVWVGSMIALAMDRPISEYLKIEPKEGGQMIVGAIGAAIWIPYILRSRRVANTFIN
jgi:hypothetical protein